MLRRVLLVSLVAAIAALSEPNYPALSYEVDPNWPALPAGWNLAETPAVSVDKQENVYVFHRGAHPIIVFNKDGKFLRSFGDGVYSGTHGLSIDHEGNIWTTDIDHHVVLKMDSNGRIRMVLGRKGQAGEEEDRFNSPTDVAIAPNGDIYVSDGYGSARVVKYSADGKYLLQWGKRGTGPGEFELPHNLVVDARGRVYVTDRSNLRIQIFDSQGKFLDQWKDIGSVSTLFMTKDQHIWTGGVLRNLKGEVVARLPGDPGGHGTTVSQSGDVFIAQLSGIVQKFSELQ